MFKKLIIINIFLFIVIESMTAAERPVTFADARINGMGNTFTAIADDKNMLFFNPAGFASYGLVKKSIRDAILNPTLWKPRYTNIGDLTVLSASLGVSGFGKLSELLDYENGPIWGIYKTMSDKFSKGLTLAEAAQLNNNIAELYSKAIHLTGNIEVMSYARHYFGFGFFSSSDLVIKLDPTRGILGIPNFQAKVYSDFIFPVGFGIPIPGHKEWSAGLTFKYFHRLKMELNGINDYVEFGQWASGGYLSKDIADYFTSHSTLDMFFNGIKYTSVPVKQFKIGTGAGLDLGVMYRPSFAWKYGLQLSDVYTKIRWWDGTESSRIPINARVGAAYMPTWSLLGLIESPILALDLEDIFHQQEKNFFLKWHFGSEVKFLFRFFSLRFGINDGYPSYGAGIDLNFNFLRYIPFLKWLRPDSVYFPKFNPKDKEFLSKNLLCCCLTGVLAPLTYAHIKADISYTGYELGIYPGQLPSYQLQGRVSLSYSY